jgi:hypothetical protein
LRLRGTVSQILGGDQYALNEIFFNEKYVEHWPTWMHSLNNAGAPAEKINNFYLDESSSNAIILHFKVNIRHRHPAFKKKNGKK